MSYLSNHQTQLCNSCAWRQFLMNLEFASCKAPGLHLACASSQTICDGDWNNAGSNE